MREAVGNLRALGISEVDEIVNAVEGAWVDVSIEGECYLRLDGHCVKLGTWCPCAKTIGDHADCSATILKEG